MFTKEWMEEDGTYVRIYDKEEELDCDSILREELAFKMIDLTEKAVPVRIILRYRMESRDNRIIACNNLVLGVAFCPYLKENECGLFKVSVLCPLNIEQQLNQHIELARFRKQLKQWAF